MAKKFWYRAMPLGLAAFLLLGGCDDEEEKPPVVEVGVPKGVEVKVKRIDEDEMVIVAELVATAGVVLWALFGPGARRRWPLPDASPVDKRLPEGGEAANGASSKSG